MISGSDGQKNGHVLFLGNLGSIGPPKLIEKKINTVEIDIAPLKMYESNNEKDFRYYFEKLSTN